MTSRIEMAIKEANTALPSRKIADLIEQHARWYIIVMMIGALASQLATTGAPLIWSVLLPVYLNPHRVQKYAVEVEGYWREPLLLFPCIFGFSYLEITMH